MFCEIDLDGGTKVGLAASIGLVAIVETFDTLDPDSSGQVASDLELIVVVDIADGDESCPMD